jgi:hypothetical protein
MIQVYRLTPLEGHSMPKWEYLVVYFRDADLENTDVDADYYADADVFTERLNTYGQAGWELVSFDWMPKGARAALKRPLKS